MSKRSGNALPSLVLALAVGGLAFAPPLSAQDRCRLSEDRSLSLPAAGLDRLDLSAKAGSLVVRGESGVDEVRVEAEFCASDEENLERMDIRFDAVRGTARLETVHPDWRDRRLGPNYARINLIVTVPLGMDADIMDGSGNGELTGLGNLELIDGSGSMVLEDIRGELIMEDGSGDLDIFGVEGSVDLEDGSGSFEIRDVSGDVRITDGSGNARLRGITGSVIVDDKGSGRLDVADVDGDLRVEGMRRERVDYQNVRGELDLPPARRKRGG